MNISGDKEKMQKSCKKVVEIFGGFAEKQYFCTRFWETSEFRLFHRPVADV